MDENLYKSLLADLISAENFQVQGQENKSRVLARQIAGKAIRKLFLELKMDCHAATNPYQYLLLAKETPQLFSSILKDLEALTRKVNYDYSFPEELNLLNSSRNIIDFVKDFNLKNDH